MKKNVKNIPNQRVQKQASANVAQKGGVVKNKNVVKGGGEREVKKVKGKARKVSKVGKLKGRPFLSTVIAGGFNFLGIAASVAILGNLSQKALELKKLRNAVAGAEKKKQVEVSDLQIPSVVEKSQALFSLFPNEPGLVDFVKEIEKLKNEGTITDFSFVNQEAVTDQTGTLGFPFVIKFSGPWEQVSEDLVKLQKLNYLVRAVNIDLKSSKDSADLVEFKYGGFIYVDQSFNQN
jgi:Tfp pilus assembly protein PilO